MGALMERTRPAEIGSDALETDVLADHLDDVGGVAHLVDDFVGYHPSSTTVTPAPPSFQAPSEIDLRGMRVGEVEDIVMHAVDAAVRADLKTLRIIHGKGTGALRDRVAEMLRKETRVTSFRLGAWNEGGAGVTVVELG